MAIVRGVKNLDTARRCKSEVGFKTDFEGFEVHGGNGKWIFN